MSDVGDTSELVAPGYKQLVLPTALQTFYDYLYPADATRYHKQFLTLCYLKLINATGFNQPFTSFDSRVTYDLADTSAFFRTYRTTTPTTNNTGFNLLISGLYNQDIDQNSFYDVITVTQVANQPNVLVHSLSKKAYLNGGLTFDNPTADAYVAVTDNQSTSMSDLIPVGTTGLSVRIVGDMTQFTATANKQWQFVAEAPFLFDFPNLFEDLVMGEEDMLAMLDYASDVADTKYAMLWNRHFNPVYRFAGLVNAYVQKLNELWQTQT